MDWFSELDPFLKIYWLIALPASLIFVVQTIMTFLGSDAADGIGADFSGHLEEAHAPFQLFSLRNLVNFLLGFSWTGISCAKVIENHSILMAVSVVVGLIFISLFFLVLNQVQKFSEDNSFKIKDTINKTANVYLAIPGNKTGTGKIMISVNGSVRELEAITEQDKKIETGSVVTVVSVEGQSLVVVKPV
jgi:membrane protein implicated in regulation of membrane protease activity